MAISEGIFADDVMPAEAKQQLLKAYIEQGLSLRLSVGYMAYVGDKSSPLFIPNKDVESHPEVCFDMVLDVCLPEPTCIHGAILVFESISHPTQRAEVAKVYAFDQCSKPIESDFNGPESADASGYRAIKWGDVIEPAEWCKDYFLRLKKESLRELFALAKSMASTSSSSTEKPKKLNAKSETSYQNIIGAMLKLLEKENAKYLARGFMINSILVEDKDKHRTGLSESHIGNTLRECERIFDAC